MFASSYFLIGLLAVGLPVAIHLLTRQKSKVLEWGAMDFLKKSINSASAKRQRLRDHLLLLLRALAIIFLILTFAQPLVSKLFMNSSSAETVLIWDISMSTSTMGIDGVSRQENIREVLLDELDDLPNNSEVRILLVGAEIRWLKDEPLSLTSNNRRTLNEIIAAQKVDAGGSSLSKAILLAMNSVSIDDADKRLNLIVVHDLQESAWQPAEKDRWTSIDKRVSDDPTISLRLAEYQEASAESGSQAAVVSLETDRDTIATGSKQRFRAILQNYSKDRIYGAEVVWLVNGEEVDRLDSIELLPSSKLNLEQFIVIETTGNQVVECRLEVDGDPLITDNSAILTLSSTTQPRVLIVDDTRRVDKGQILPSQFITAALGGSLSDKSSDENDVATQSRSLFNPKVIRSEELEGAMLGDYLAVIIANADSLPSSSYDQFKEFVASGGGIWLMMGEQNGGLSSWTSTLLDRLDLGSLNKTKIIENSDKEKPMRIAASRKNTGYSDAIAADNLDLSRSNIAKLHQLTEVNFLDSERLLQTPDGDPILLSIPAHPGRVILQMCDLSRSNTNLPILQTFVPIMRETIRECVGDGISLKNINPGEVIRVSSLNETTDGDEIIVTRPDGSTTELKKLGEVYQTANTFLPGLYQIDGFEDASGKKTTQIFNVKRSKGESNITSLNREKATQLISGEAFSELTTEEHESKRKVSLAMWFAILSGMFFIAEAILAHRLAKRSQKSSGRINLKPVY